MKTAGLGVFSEQLPVTETQSLGEWVPTGPFGAAGPLLGIHNHSNETNAPPSAVSSSGEEMLSDHGSR